jgi:hypothetical protein
MRGNVVDLLKRRPLQLAIAVVLFALGGWLVWVLAIAILQPPDRSAPVVASFAGLWLVLGLLGFAVADTVRLLRARRAGAPDPEPQPHPPAWLTLVVPAAFLLGVLLGHMAWT